MRQKQRNRMPDLPTRSGHATMPSNTYRRPAPRDPLAPLWRERERRIRIAAYLKAERRGFAAGHELDDWLSAEHEVDAAIRSLSID